MGRLLLFLCFLAFNLVALAQNDFRSRQTGDWNDPDTWQEFVAGSWQNTGNTPTSADGVITIRSPHVVTVTAGLTIDQTIVQAGGTLAVNVGVILSVADGDGNDLVNQGVVSAPSVDEIEVLTGATYEHARNGGNIPLATWNPGSTALISGITNAAPGNLNPAGGFRNIVWDCPGQSTAISLEGELRTVLGDLTIQNTNSTNVRLSIASAPVPINIGGNFTISGNSTRVAFTTSASLTVNVAGDFIYTSTDPTGTLFVNASGNGSVALNVSGNFEMDAPGGALSFSNGPGTGVVTVLGDFILNNGTITETSSGSGSFVFNGNGTQNFTNTGSIQQNISYAVGSNSALNVLGSSPLSGKGSFTLDGTIRLGSLDEGGALSLGSSGNIRTTGARTFNSGSRVVYAGTGPQFIGDGHPSVPGVITEINNSNGVTFNTTTTGNTATTTLTIRDDLILTSGNLNIVSNSTDTRALVINGSITDNGNHITFSGERSDLEIRGSGAMGNFPFPAALQTLRTFTMNRSSGSVTFPGQINVTNSTNLINGTIDLDATSTLTNLALAAGTTVFFEGQSLTISNDFTTTGGVLSGDSESTLTLTGAVAHTSPLAFAVSGNTLGTLELNKGNTGTSAIVNASLTVVNTLSLINGRIDNVSNSLTVNNGATIIRNSGSNIGIASPSGGPWHVIYTGGSLSTSREIPPSGELLSLTVNSNNGATVSLTSNITISGTLTVTSSGRTFDSGSRTITTGSLISSGVFVAPSTTLRITGSDIVINGTYTNSSGTLIIDSDVVMSGTTIDDARFFTITINPGATLTPSAVLSIQGDFTNNGTFVAGTGTVVFRGATASRVLSGTTNTQFYNITLNKSTGATTSLTVTTPQTVTNALLVNIGILSIVDNTLVLNNGATLTRNNTGSIITTSPGGGPWNLVYIGINMSTGLEIPPSGILSSLTDNMNNGTTLNLTQSITVANAITINTQGNGPIFASGNNNVTAGSLIVNGVFTAPASGFQLTLSGSLENNGTFNHNSGTVVFNGTSSLSGSSTTTFQHVTISGVLNPLVNFRVSGHFVNNGTFNPGTTTITFNGSGTQNISGTSVTTFNNIIVSNTTSPGVRIESNQNLRGAITLTPNAYFDADGSANTAIFTLLSTNDLPAEDASVTELPTSANFLGSVTVQRYFRAADNYDRFISSPVATATVAQLQSVIPITGNFTGTSYPCTGCLSNAASMWYYGEPASGDINFGYHPVPSSGGTNAQPLVPAMGYDVWMWDGGSPTTLSFSGPINRGNYSYTVTHTPSTPVNSADGWNLIGNPYPSAIQWNNGPGWEKTNIDPTVWVWDVVGRVWHSYNANTNAGDLTNGIIASGQGFWVYVPNVAPASLSINEQAKSVQGSSGYYRTAGPRIADLTVRLSKGEFSDNAYVFLDANASEGYDQGLEAVKPVIGIERMSVSFPDGSGKTLGYMAVKHDMLDEIPIHVMTEAPGEYEFTFEVVNTGFAKYYLVDRKLGEVMQIENGNTYNFKLTGNPGEKVSESERFYLTPYPEIASAQIDRKIRCYPNPTSGLLNIEISSHNVLDIQLLDLHGKTLEHVDFYTVGGNTSATLDMNKYSQGLFLIKTVTDRGFFLDKIIKN